MVEWSEAELREKLSARQFEVLALVAQRFSSKEIGRQLGLSHKTVDNHVADFLAKLELSTRADAARVFLEAQQGRERLPRVSKPLDGPPIDPSSLGQPAEFDDVNISAQPASQGAWRTVIDWFRLPPVGGPRHDLDAAQRMTKIGIISLVSSASVLGGVVVIVGILSLLNK